MDFDELPEFQRDLRQLLKKYRTLRDDLEVLKKVLAVASHPQPPLSYRIPGLGFETPIIIKLKRFASRSLKGKGSNTGFRLIYAYHQQTELIQFVQLYFKVDEANEDKERILRHFYVAK
jgi:mRNA-degrading endonuclease RelE of RelBE toxin-antitoxin system